MKRILVVALIVLGGSVAGAQPVPPSYRPPVGTVTGEYLEWDGTKWVASGVVAGDITSVGATAGGGLTGGATAGPALLGLITTCADGQVLKSTTGSWACADDGGGGITNSAGANVVMKSDGTNAVATPMTSTSTDTLIVPQGGTTAALIQGTSDNTYLMFGANQDVFIRGGKAASQILIGDATNTGGVNIGSATNPTNVAGTLGVTGAFSTASGNILGDGMTDTTLVNGYAGINSTPDNNVGLKITKPTGATYGLYVASGNLQVQDNATIGGTLTASGLASVGGTLTLDRAAGLPPILSFKQSGQAEWQIYQLSSTDPLRFWNSVTSADSCTLTTAGVFNCLGGLQVNGTNVALASSVSGTSGRSSRFDSSSTVATGAFADDGTNATAQGTLNVLGTFGVNGSSTFGDSPSDIAATAGILRSITPTSTEPSFRSGKQGATTEWAIGHDYATTNFVLNYFNGTSFVENLFKVTSAGDATIAGALTVGGNLSFGTSSSNTTALNGTVTINDNLAFASTAPASFSTRQDNYTGCANTMQCSLTPTASATITGFQAPSSGQLLYIVNVAALNSGFNITLTHEDSNSTSTNRILTTAGANAVIPPQQWALLMYDGSATRWRVINRNRFSSLTVDGQTSFANGPSGINNYDGTHLEWSTECTAGIIQPTATINWPMGDFVASSSQTVTGSNAFTIGGAVVSGRPGVCEMSTFTSATGRDALTLLYGGVDFSSGNWTYETAVSAPTLSTSTQEYVLVEGLVDDPTSGGNFTDGCGFAYDRAGSMTDPGTGDATGTPGDFWQIWCASNGTRTGYILNTTTVAEDSFARVSSSVSAGSWYRLKIVMEGTTKARFYINNIEVGRITTNIPSGTTRAAGVYNMLLKTVGTTARLFQIDWIRVAVDLTSARSP